MASTTEKKKNMFRQAREAMGLTRDAAADLLETIPYERIVRIENETYDPVPEEIVIMAEKYKAPGLYNYYCTEKCKLGQRYVPKIRMKDLSQIVLEMLAYLNSVQDKTKRLVEIAVDGSIDNKELEDFVQIQRELEQISVAVETLQLWSEQMLASGKIDMEQYKKLMAKK